MAPAAKRRKTDTQAQRFLCYGCDVERTASQFPDYNPSSECEHLINTCKTCLKQWVAVQVDDTNFVKKPEDSKMFGVACPHPGCEGVMRAVNVEIAATQKVSARYVGEHQKVAR